MKTKNIPLLNCRYSLINALNGLLLQSLHGLLLQSLNGLILQSLNGLLLQSLNGLLSFNRRQRDNRKRLEYTKVVIRSLQWTTDRQ